LNNEQTAQKKAGIKNKGAETACRRATPNARERISPTTSSLEPLATPLLDFSAS
jgi:hypothetical protein